jgi:hypothetical protein
VSLQGVPGACEMKLLCDVRKADWRAEITVLLYLAGVTPAFLPDGAPSLTESVSL